MIGFFFLQSESPWQHNDAITIFIYLCVPLYREFFFKKSLKGGCTCHNFLNYGKTLNKLYESVLEIF